LASATGETVPMLEMRSITKRFPGVLANDHVDFDLRAGEIHTLFGENGAGKSTLMRVLYGLYRPDEGEVRIDGEPVTISTPAAAIRHGIGMIHQHFMLVPTLTVAENVALGLKSSRAPLKDRRRVSARIEELSAAYGLAVTPDALVWQLSVGERQRVEIMKALYREARLLVLDEPTAVLTPGEVDDLFEVLHQMTADGRGLVFISHKIREVLALSNRITVLRGGRKIATVETAAVSAEQLADMMVGHQLAAEERATGATAGGVRLLVRDLRVGGDGGTDAVRDLSLEVRAGEIVGIAGVSGNGQRELAEAIAGLRPASAGSITLDGVELDGRGPAGAREAGLGYVPEERMRDGVVGDFTVAENVLLVDCGKPAFSRWGFLRRHAIRARAEELVTAFDVRTPNVDTPTRNLSGGNIQKLIMARELSGDPKALLVAQPTRGIDLGAARYIHNRLRDQSRRGIAILIISQDLDEVIALSDRILVMYEGAVIGEAGPQTTTSPKFPLIAGTRSVLGWCEQGVRGSRSRLV
jgi:general nucleoside transport system ATP-binding protein